mgnify:CR=1 FL=1
MRLHTVAEIRLGQTLPVRAAAQPPTTPMASHEYTTTYNTPCNGGMSSVAIACGKAKQAACATMAHAGRMQRNKACRSQPRKNNSSAKSVTRPLYSSIPTQPAAPSKRTSQPKVVSGWGADTADRTNTWYTPDHGSKIAMSASKTPRLMTV